MTLVMVGTIKKTQIKTSRLLPK